MYAKLAHSVEVPLQRERRMQCMCIVSMISMPYLHNYPGPTNTQCKTLLSSTLRKIPEPLSKLQLLVVRIDNVFTKPIVRDLFLLQLFIKAIEHHAEQEAADDRRAKHGQRDGVAAAVAVGRQAPDVGAGDVADLAESVDHGDGDGAFGWGAREG
jgi:hypothetical protein